MYEHVVVAEQMLGRDLLPAEVIHHRNEDKSDNRPENLEVLPSRAHHAEKHRRRTDLRRVGEGNPTVACTCGCGTTFLRYDRSNRPRRYVTGHNGKGR